MAALLPARLHVLTCLVLSNWILPVLCRSHLVRSHPAAVADHKSLAWCGCSCLHIFCSCARPPAACSKSRLPDMSAKLRSSFPCRLLWKQGLWFQAEAPASPAMHWVTGVPAADSSHMMC